jgi:hypothetical protein
MKSKGCTPNYSDERIDDLMTTYTSLLGSYDGYIDPEELFKRVVNMPSKRFWVSAERAAIVLSNMRKGDDLSNMGRTRREMFHEIYRRAEELQRKHPDMSIRQLAINVVYQPAPKFYLTAGSARVIIYKARREWCRRRRLVRRRYSVYGDHTTDNTGEQ